MDLNAYYHCGMADRKKMEHFSSRAVLKDFFVLQKALDQSREGIRIPFICRYEQVLGGLIHRNYAGVVPGFFDEDKVSVDALVAQNVQVVLAATANEGLCIEFSSHAIRERFPFAL